MASNKNLPFYLNLKLKIILIYHFYNRFKKLPSIARCSRYLYEIRDSHLLHTHNVKVVIGLKLLSHFYSCCHLNIGHLSLSLSLINLLIYIQCVHLILLLILRSILGLHSRFYSCGLVSSRLSETKPRRYILHYIFSKPRPDTARVS